MPTLTATINLFPGDLREAAKRIIERTLAGLGIAVVDLHTLRGRLTPEMLAEPADIALIA